MSESVSERFRLAQKLVSAKQDVARAIADDREPGREFRAADVCFHLEFLAGAIEAGSTEAFADYARWTTRMLGARGIAAHAFEEHLAKVEKHLAMVLLPGEREIVVTFLARGRAACMEPEPASGTQTPEDPLGLTRQVFLAAILSGQRQAAVNIVEEALRTGHSHVDIYIDVFTETLRRVGKLWELNKISVAQEHIATSITQYAIAIIYPRLAPPPLHRGNMVVTGVSGELHQIGANLVADAMEANGWSVRFLGTNLPPASVLSVIEESSADVLCISTTIVANLPSVSELVQIVRGKLGVRTPKIVLGGSAYPLATQFAREIGVAAAFTDLRQAIDTLCA